ncbi:polyprenol phosphomannose-dependent alpha 1,6 mannosyltransferase MptB [Streptomyces sp. NPDC007189]|uniref:polyprenol phosphomannose-dependent alpha 1,6 mannosyltransferase MptB n=1 Tax=unclassified Streptomyces TaxID=2593676 RepID=UPI0033D2B4FE
MAGAGIALFALVGASAPNHNTLRAPITWLRLPAMPDTASQTVTIAAIVLSCWGALSMLRAHEQGWRPDARLLVRLGALAALAVANLTPVGSSDMASYASYGRIAALGGDPYVTTPAQLGGAYAHLVSQAWRNTPSVYGPVATWWQATAAFVGQERPWLTIWALMLANAAVFAGTGYLLLRTADDPVRAALLWSVNPLLIGVLVGGGHLDTLVAGLAVCAVHLARKATRWHHDLIVGALVGLSCGVKISACLLGAGLAWPLLRSGTWRPALRQACGGALTLAAVYGAYGAHALAPLSAASRLVSAPSLWAVFDQFGAAVLGPRTATAIVGVLWPVVMIALAWLLHRRTAPHAPTVGALPFALAFAWVLAAPWSMPWYTALAWAMAALFGQGRPTRYLAVTTAVLALSHNSGGHGWTW